MSVLRPLDKLPSLNTATVLALSDWLGRCAGTGRVERLLVSSEDMLLQQLANSMLKEDCSSKLKIHLANGLPLPSDGPRFDLIVFLINLHSKYSLQIVEGSLQHLDITFFLGKVLFLVTGAGRESQCSTHRNTVERLAHTYRSPLLFCDLERETFRASLAPRLVHLLQICAGHVPGVSAMDLLTLLRWPENPMPEEP